jgi:hypothetical protein
VERPDEPPSEAVLRRTNVHFGRKEPEMSAQGRRPSAAERKAEQAFKQPETKKATSEYERAQNTLHANFQRLRSERLKRESAATDSAKQKG